MMPGVAVTSDPRLMVDAGRPSSPAIRRTEEPAATPKAICSRSAKHRNRPDPACSDTGDMPPA